MSYPAISLATATVGRHRCPQKRLQTARQPPVYPNSSPDHRACNSLTPSAVLTPSIPVHRWIRAYAKEKAGDEKVATSGAVFAPRHLNGDEDQEEHRAQGRQGQVRRWRQDQLLQQAQNPQTSRTSRLLKNPVWADSGERTG